MTDVEILNESGEVTARYDVYGSFFEFRHPYYPDKFTRINKLLRNRMLIRMDPTAEKTQSGILWLPPKKVRKPQTGIVLMRSELYWDFESKTWNQVGVGIGDKVLFRPISGMPIYYGFECEVWIFRPGAILAILEQTGPLQPYEEPYTPFPHYEDKYEEETEEETGDTTELEDLF